jgi:hypothetical protein
MRHFLFLACGLMLVPLAGFALAQSSEPGSKPSAPGLTASPVKPVTQEKSEGACGSHGTRVDFLDTPREAAKIAKKEQKLVFVLHVSGNFEDPRFT